MTGPHIATRRGDGAGGIVTIRYRARLPRFKGGAITRGGGWIMHTFGDSGTLKRRWWTRTTVVEYLVIGGGGGASSTGPGEPGESAAGVAIVTSPAVTVTVGKGGEHGGGHGGHSSLGGPRL